jgi:hypothetical protein
LAGANLIDLAATRDIAQSVPVAGIGDSVESGNRVGPLQ